MQSFRRSLLQLRLLLHLLFFCHWGRRLARQCCNLWVVFATSCSLRRILAKASVVLMLHEPELRSLVVVEELLLRLIGVKLVGRMEHDWLLWSLQLVLETTTSQVFGRTHALRLEMRRWHLVLLLHKMAVHTHIKLLALTRRTVDIEH